MKNVKLMSNNEIKNEMETLRYMMDLSVHRRHEVPEIYAFQLKRYNELDDERYGR